MAAEDVEETASGFGEWSPNIAIATTPAAIPAAHFPRFPNFIPAPFVGDPVRSVASQSLEATAEAGCWKLAETTSACAFTGKPAGHARMPPGR